MGSLTTDGQAGASEALRPREAERGPLSYGQQRLWFLDRWLGGRPVYNSPGTFRFTGPLDADRLAAAVAATAARHDVLFTVIEDGPDGPRQRVNNDRELSCPIVDLTHLGAAQAEVEAQRLIDQDAKQSFDLANGPMLRAHIFRVADDAHWLQLTCHHIAFDGWSLEVFQRQLVEAYRADGAPALPPAVQYADYALWQREAMEGRAATKALENWSRTLADAPSVLDLGADRPRPAELSYRGRTESFALADIPLAQLEKLAADEGVTLYVVLLAAFQALVARHAGRDDIVLGSPTAGRGASALDELVGYFVDLLVIRTSLAEDPTFRTLLGRTRGSVLDALSRSKVPFDMAVNHLHPERNLSYSPIVQAVFQVHEEDGAGELADGIAIERVLVPTDTAKYDVTWSVYRGTEGLRLEVEYATDLFDAATVRAFVGHWETLLRAVVADPDVALSAIDIATEAEAEQIRQWSNEKRQLPGGVIHELVAQSAAATPNAIAVTCAGESLTYAELNGRATTLARHLRTLGVGPERCAGVLMERSLDTVTACLAILKAGGIYVPLDTAFPGDRMAFMLEGVAAPVVLAHKATVDLVPEGAWSVIDIADVSEIAESNAESDSEEFPIVSQDNGAYVIYTSGSTGRPKGTMVTHRNVVRLIQGANEKLSFSADDVWSVFHSFAFDVSVFEMWGALTTGGHLVVVPYALSRDAEAFHALVRDEHVTILSQTPSAFRQFETADEAAGGELSVRAVIFAGEALHRPSLRRWASRHGYASPLLVNMYGITETTVHTTYLELAAADLEHELTVIGGPLPDLSLHVLDSHGRPCAAGVTGEIHVGGAGVTRGYNARPELTAERFVPDHVTGQVGARLYKSGDLARWTAQGELEYVGRSDFQVKIRGYRIETGEIEAHLSAHAELREAVVIARTGPDGQADLAAYLVPVGEAPAPDELRAWLRTRIPDYMVPRHFVFLDALPLTAQGKLDRRALPEPQAIRPQLAQEFVAPLGEVEENLAEIWGRVLGVDRVGRHDNFFDLGGDSIRSIQVLGQARTDGLGFEIQDLFRSPTIAGLATVVQISDVADPGSGPAPAAAYEPFSMISEADRALLPEGLEDAYPMAELQVGMVYEMELNTDRRAYLNLDGLRIVGPFDEARFREATARVVARHPILRTAFDLSTYSEPLQLVYPTAEMPFVVDDLRHLDEAAQDKLLDEYVAAERNRPFDHSRPLLLRFALHRLTDESFSWTLTEHHAIFDGWSLHSTIAEIADVYQKLLAGEGPVLPAPISAYRDFIAAERETIKSPESRQYWLEHISDRPETKLPRWGAEHAPQLTGREHPNEWRDVHADQGIGTVETLLPEALCDQLRELARQCGAPFKAVLLAAHLKVVSFVTGSDDLLVGVTVNGRVEEEGSTDVRGMFLNTAPFRIKLPDGSWRDLITAVFETERELLPHRRYPFGVIQREIGGAELVDVNFVHNHFHVLDKAFGDGRMRITDNKIDSFTTDRVEPTNFALNVGMIRNPYSNQVIFGMDYHTDKLNADQILLYRDYYLRAFEAMVADPAGQHQWVSLIGPEERTLLTQWSGEQKQLPAGTVHELVAQAAAEQPNAVAVTSGGESLTYAELEQRAATLARRLRALGVGPEACVGVCMTRSLEMVVACLAVLKAGGVYVPLDTAFPADRIEFMLNEVDAKVVLVHEPTSSAIPNGTWRLVKVDDEESELDESSANDAELPAVHSENGCYVIFTSGSTGKPKGTNVTHRNVVRLIHGVRELLPFGADDVWSVFHSFAFDFSVWELWGGLTTGGRVVVVPHSVTRDTEAFHALVRDEKVTILSQTPSAFRQFETADEQAGGELSLRAVIFGGEALHRPSVRRWASRHGYASPLLVNMYGITETTVHVTYQPLAEAYLEGEFSQIGRPLPDLSVHILDQHGRPCPVGVTGEIHVGGAGVTRGYTGRPGLTAERFVPDHLSGQPGARLYRSGDLARWTAQGGLEYVGRGDAQVKIRGYRIETGEIETVLGTHPRLLEAAVIARTGADGQTDLIGYLVPDASADGVAPAHDELRAWLAQRLPGYMVPRHLVFLDALPLTAQGKVDRRALPEPAAIRPDFTQEFSAPIGPVEELLAEIWGRVLGVDRVGRDDNFFDLGGDSIRGLQVVGQARSTGMNVRLADINRYPTLGTLAEITEQQKATASAAPAKPAAKPSPFALLSERDRARLAARGSQNPQAN